MREFSIDPTFSVYGLVGRVQNVNVSATLSHRRTMSIVSYEIENATLVDGARTRVFSSFQRMSKFLPQMERYQELARKAEAVWVFGVPDVWPDPIPNVTYVPLKPEDQLAKEWFLVSYGPSYFSALATEETTDIDMPDEQRQFKGLWTFELSMVQILYDWLTSTVGFNTQYLEPDHHDYQQQTAILHRTIQRMQQRRERHKNPLICDELGHIIEHSLNPAMSTLSD